MTNPGTKSKKTRAGQTCPACHAVNRADSRFCANCAAPLKSGGTAAPDGSRTIRATTLDIARGNRIGGRYEIIEELGQGGMGRVFRVFDHQVGEIVALKLIRPEIGAQDKAIERFKNELKFTRKITHRNICRMYDLGEIDLLHYITMEYVAGEDLKRFIKKAGPLNAGKAVSIAKQVCAGLAEAHRAGAVHRDLKPQNIMIDAEGTPKIMDFGIARFAEMDRMTGSGVMIGTPEYMSPEQAELKEVDKRADIYALGCVLFEMVTGRVPFEGETALGLAMKHKMEKPRDVRELNPHVMPALADVVAKCLEKDPARRYQDADELLAALNAVEADLASGERAVPADFLRTPAPGTGAAGRPTSAPATPKPGTAAQPAVAATPPPASVALAPETPATPATPVPVSKSGAAAGPRTGKKPPAAIFAVAGLVVVAVILFLLFGKKKPEEGTVAPGGDTPAVETAPAYGDSADAREAGQARERMIAAKTAASQAGLDSGQPFVRAALSLEKEAESSAGDKELVGAKLAFGVAERMYRLSAELSSDDLRLEGMKAFVAEARAAADEAINANPDNKLLSQALTLERQGEAATIKKNVEDAALARGRAALTYKRIEAAFRGVRK